MFLFVRVGFEICKTKHKCPKESKAKIAELTASLHNLQGDTAADTLVDDSVPGNVAIYSIEHAYMRYARYPTMGS